MPGLASKSGAPAASANGGTSGSVGSRISDETASARSFVADQRQRSPASAKPRLTCPAAMSATPAAGCDTAHASSQAKRCAMNSIDRCCELPRPAVL
jgi:hypothetical protein